MTADEEIAKRMIAAHWLAVTRARTDKKRNQHKAAVAAYQAAFPNLLGPWWTTTHGHSGRRYQAAEAERGRLWNWTDSTKEETRR